MEKQRFIISGQREGRFFVKQVSQEQYGKLVDCHHDIEYWNCVFDSSPEYLVEGSVTGNIGDSVEGFLRDTCHECKNSRICNLNDKCQWPIQVFVPRSATPKFETEQEYLEAAAEQRRELTQTPRSASTVETDKNKNVMATPTLNEEYEARKIKAKELIAAGGCHAISYWSRTDAERLCPEQHKDFDQIEVPVYISDWISAGETAIKLIQEGINILRESGVEPESKGEAQAEWEFLQIIQANYEIAKRGDNSEWANYSPKSAVLETYEDLIEIIKGLPLKRAGSTDEYLKSIGALQQPTYSREHMIEFLEWAAKEGWEYFSEGYWLKVPAFRETDGDDFERKTTENLLDKFLNP